MVLNVRKFRKLVSAFVTINTNEMFVFFTTTKRIEKLSAYSFFAAKDLSPQVVPLLLLLVSTYFDRRSSPTCGIRARMPKQMSSPYKVTRGEVTIIKSGKEGSVTL